MSVNSMMVVIIAVTFIAEPANLRLLTTGIDTIGIKYCCELLILFKDHCRGHGGRVVTLSPPTSEAGVQSPSWPQVGKLVVACRWSAVYSTEP